MEHTSKVVKIDSKIIIVLPWPQSVKLTLRVKFKCFEFLNFFNPVSKEQFCWSYWDRINRVLLYFLKVSSSVHYLHNYKYVGTGLNLSFLKTRYFNKFSLDCLIRTVVVLFYYLFMNFFIRFTTIFMTVHTVAGKYSWPSIYPVFFNLRFCLFAVQISQVFLGAKVRYPPIKE